MAVHEIYIDKLPRLDIQAADIEFEIRSDGYLVGRLKVSRGTLAWKPNNARKDRHIDWEQFDKIARKWPTEK